MKTVNEIKDLIAEKREAILGLKTKAETEKRDAFTAEEKTTFNKLVEERKALESDLETAQELESQVAARSFAKVPSVVLDAPSSRADKDLKSYSFMKAIRSKVFDTKVDGLEAEMHQEALKEARENGTTIEGIGVPSFLLTDSRTRAKDGVIEQRAATATGQTTVVGDQGGITIEKSMMGLIDVIYSKTWFAESGVKMIKGLQGNLTWPTQTAKLVVSEKGENVAVDETDAVWGSVDLAPQRIGAFTKFSKQLLMQSSLDVENIIVDNLRKAFTYKIQTRGYNKVIAAATELGVTVPANSGLAITYDHILQMEEAIALADLDGNPFTFLTNPKVRKKLKLSPELANTISLPVWKDDMVAGYKAISTNYVPGNLANGASGNILSAAVLGDFSKLYACQWGGLDLVVNPYSEDKEGFIRLTGAMFVNEFIERAGAFNKFTKITTV